MYNLVIIKSSRDLGRSVGGFSYTQLFSSKPIAIKHGTTEYYHKCQPRICEGCKGHAVVAQACYDPANQPYQSRAEQQHDDAEYEEGYKHAQRYNKKCTYASEASTFVEIDRFFYLIAPSTLMGSLLTDGCRWGYDKVSTVFFYQKCERSDSMGCIVRTQLRGNAVGRQMFECTAFFHSKEIAQLVTNYK